VSDRYAVFGNPIAHSKSPLIHRLFAEQTHQDLVYEAILAPLDGFFATVQRFIAEGGRGGNVTVPFKTQAHDLSTRLSERAALAGAVNTLCFGDGGDIYGDNTDGEGLVQDLTVNLGVMLHGARILVLGAGGAARGALASLLAATPAEVVILNRTADKAAVLATQFQALGKISGGGYGLQGKQSYDLVINATAASLAGDLPPLSAQALHTSTVCYDMVYGAAPTAFMRWASAHGTARVYDGLGMLVEQAATAFALWRGVRPITAPVIQAVRSQLSRSAG